MHEWPACVELERRMSSSARAGAGAPSPPDASLARRCTGDVHSRRVSKPGAGTCDGELRSAAKGVGARRLLAGRAALPSGVELPRHEIHRFVTALFEGGSLPAVVEDEEGVLQLAKWRGAGQGPAALVAEVIAGELARRAGLRVPALSVLSLERDIAQTERHDEIHDLLMASLGNNLGMAFLSGALAYDPAAEMPLEPEEAAAIVLFDAYVTNVDRTARNTNLLWCGGELWLIDHGAAMYWHHGWDGKVNAPGRDMPGMADHVLLPRAASLSTVSDRMLDAWSDAAIAEAVSAVPSEWLLAADVESADVRRAAYVEFLAARRDAARGEGPNWLTKAEALRAGL